MIHKVDTLVAGHIGGEPQSTENRTHQVYLRTFLFALKILRHVKIIVIITRILWWHLS